MDAAGKSVAGAVIAVFAQIPGVISGIKRGVCRLLGGTVAAVRVALGGDRDRFHIVNASAVPIVASTEQHTQLFVGAEPFADRAAHFVQSSPADDGRAPTDAIP